MKQSSGQTPTDRNLYNCRAATQLMVQAEDRVLSAAEVADLNAHLRGCDACRTWRDNAAALDASMMAMLQPENGEATPASENWLAALKKDLQRRLDEGTSPSA